MDLSAHSTHTTVERQAGAQELSLPSTECETENGGTVLLQLLEFKTHLLEAVEELHIRRDAEARFEDQLSKLMLEKQRLEWEKESLQHQIDTVVSQSKDSLTNVKEQVKIRSTEEEKWKYQLSAELKDKEVNNLKEELKSLQLLKYNTEKKSSELEQKLALQSRSKDLHMNQLGEVEKRFTALSRQCAMVKQAFEKLEQNVNEAMSINRKLSSVNGKQVATIVSLKQELEEVSKQLIKARMTSSSHDKSHSSAGKEQHIRWIQQKLKMETENNKKLCEESEMLRAEQQEVIKSLKHAQHLLLSQTQTVNRVEQELQTQREQNQALKQEHETMREKSKALEDKLAQLMESCAVSKTSWDKEIRDGSRVPGVCTRVFPTSAEEVRAEKSFNEPIPSTKMCMLGSLQHVALTLTRSPDCLQDTGAVTNAAATGATQGQEALNHHPQRPYNQPINHSDLFMCPLITNDLFSLNSHSGTNACTNMLNEYSCNSNTYGSDANVTYASSALSDNIFHVSSASGTTGMVYEPVHSVSKVKHEKLNVGIREEENTGRDDGNQEKNSRKEQHSYTELQWNGADGKGGGSAGETRGTLLTQTTDTAARQEDSKRSAVEAGDTRTPEPETRDSVEGEAADGVEHTSEAAETQIRAQTAADTTIEESNQQQVVDITHTEPPLPFSESSDCSQSIALKLMDADLTHPNEGRVGLLLNSGDGRRVNCVTQEAQALRRSEVQTQDAEPLTRLPTHIHPVPDKIPTEEKPRDTSAACFTRELSEPLSQNHRAPTALVDPSDITSSMCGTNVTEECLSVRTQAESQSSPEQEPLVTDDDLDGNSSAHRTSEGQSSGGRHEMSVCQTAQETLKPLQDTCVSSVQNTRDAKSTKGEAQSKLQITEESPEAGCSTDCEEPPAKQMLLDNTSESSLHISKTYRPSFDWGRAHKKAADSRTQSDVSAQNQASEQNTSWSDGRPRRPSSTIPMFLKNKHSKVPLVISRASELLNASSVSGTAAYLRRHPPGEWKTIEETCRETTAANTENRSSPSIMSFPSSASCSTVSRSSWQAAPGSINAPTSAADFTSEVDWDPCSQEREDEQSSFRAQISKIEQFLNKDRLGLPKR